MNEYVYTVVHEDGSGTKVTIKGRVTEQSFQIAMGEALDDAMKLFPGRHSREFELVTLEKKL